MLQKTGNRKLVMQTMRHVDAKTAMKYQHPELDIVRSALNDTEPGVPQATRIPLRHIARHSWKIRSDSNG